MTSQEDDATELQFPKDMEALDINRMVVMNERILCNSCQVILHYPYILCSDCESQGESVNICLYCFSKGKEFLTHTNDHKYSIVKDNSIFSPWKGSEELQLLEELLYCGNGNWTEISKNMDNKTPEECKIHYLKYYIENPRSDELSAVIQYKSKPLVTPYAPSIGILDPPRPNTFSSLYKNMCGYNAARGDFDIEYKNDAENLIKDLDVNLFNSEDTIGQNLQFAVLDIYRRQLGERETKKRIIREHGFINLRKLNILHNHYKSALPQIEKIIPTLHHLLSQEEMIYLLEGLCYEEELKASIKELKEYRINGLQKQEQATLYDVFKKRRENMKRKKYKLVSGSEMSALYAKEFLNINLGNKANSLKRASIPLDITGEIEYDTLNEYEQNLVSTLRILPARYNKIKISMIEECVKLNGLQLRHARNLFKIDVNKVKKIYDYLISEGLVYKPLP